MGSHLVRVGKRTTAFALPQHASAYIAANDTTSFIAVDENAPSRTPAPSAQAVFAEQQTSAQKPFAKQLFTDVDIVQRDAIIS